MHAPDIGVKGWEWWLPTPLLGQHEQANPNFPSAHHGSFIAFRGYFHWQRTEVWALWKDFALLVLSNAPSLLDHHGKITSANVLVSPVWFLHNSGDSMQHFAPQCLICVCHVLHPAVSFSKYRNFTESREMGAGQGWTCAMTDSHCWPLVFSYCICQKLVVSNACYKSSC